MVPEKSLTKIYWRETACRERKNGQHSIGGAPVTQQVKRWPADLVAPSSRPAQKEITSETD